MASRPASRNWLPEVALYCAACLSLLASCIIWSSKKQQWVDEIYTRTQASDQSFKHMLHALWLIGPGSIPLFYITVWAWARVFGYSDLSLRLYSSIGMCAAMLVLAATLRRCWPRDAVALGVLSVWCTSSYIAIQNADGRGYGLYMLTAALATAAYLRVALKVPADKRSLSLLALSQAALVLTHLVGLIFGAFMLLALIVFDKMHQRLRPVVYLCLASGWLALLFWIPSIQKAFDTNRPHGWILPPVPVDLLITYAFGFFQGFLSPSRWPWIAALIVVFVFICVAGLLCIGFKSFLHPETEGQKAMTLLGLLILTTPLVAFVMSHLTTSFYLDRYLLPTGIGFAIAFTSIANYYLHRKKTLLISVAFIILPVLSAVATPASGFDVGLIDRSVGDDLPIIASSQHDFFVLLRYSIFPQRYLYVLDWQTALTGDRWAVTDFHIMRDYRDQGYYAHNIVDQSGFLCSHPDFFVLTNSLSTWFAQTISASPNYSSTPVAKIDREHSLLAVHQVTRPQLCNSVDADNR